MSDGPSRIDRRDRNCEYVVYYDSWDSGHARA